MLLSLHPCLYFLWSNPHLPCQSVRISATCSYMLPDTPSRPAARMYATGRLFLKELRVLVAFCIWDSLLSSSRFCVGKNGLHLAGLCGALWKEWHWAPAPQDRVAATLLNKFKAPLFCRMGACATCSLTRELGLSNTTKMTKMLAFWAAWTAARTLSLPSRKRPRPSETMRSSWAVSAEAVHYREGKRENPC
jgi:ferredoxin